MSAAREKDQADFDLETFVDLFDTAMSSDNPAVQRALKNLLMIAAIVGAEDTEAGMKQGPLRRVLEDQKNILRRLERVENEKSYQQPNTYGPVPLQPNMPTPWVVNPTVWPTPVQSPSTGIPPFPPGTIWTTTNTSGTSYTMKDGSAKAATQAHMSVASLDGFLDKLETKQ
jgi:hypothetical protein